MNPFKRVEFCITTIDLHLEACDQRNPLDQRNPIKIRTFRGKQVGYDTDLPDAKNRTSAAIVVLANEAEPPQNWQQTIHPVVFTICTIQLLHGICSCGFQVREL